MASPMPPIGPQAALALLALVDAGHLKGERRPPPRVYRPPLAARNARCPCGSGKKYKKCCRVVGGGV